MNSRLVFLPLAVLSVLVGAGLSAYGDAGSIASDEIVREIYVPFEDLAGLLEDQPQRVLLSRSEYEALQRKARKEPKVPAPRSVMLVSADYAITVGQDRAKLVGTIAVEVLNDGLHAVGLELHGVGLRAATLDSHGASIGGGNSDGYELFIEGVGRHELVLNMVARVETTAAQQSLSFQVPTPPGTRMRLTVPGDVEIKHGAHIVNRTFDEVAQITRFELLPRPAKVSVVNDEASQVTIVEPGLKPGTVSLVMTLNNRLLQSRRVVVSRSVIVDEITEAYERLHATFSMAVLHRPVDSFRFALPDGFELTDVNTPLLSHWVVKADEPKRVLEIRLREPTTDTVRITLSGVSTAGESRLVNWTLPQIKPLDVAGQVAVVGLLLEDRLKVTTLSSDEVIPIDTQVLKNAFPATLLSHRVGQPRLRAVAAFYAPVGIGAADVHGRFEKPPAALSVQTSVLLMLEEQNWQVRGGFTLQPEIEKIFAIDFSVPNAWHITSVTDAAGDALSFEVYGSSDGGGSRVCVDLPSGVASGAAYNLYFQAVNTPADWLSDWVSTDVVFPVFTVAGASRDAGAIAVHGGADMVVYPERLEHLTPLDEDEKAAYRLADAAKSFRSPAYRYEAHPYHATFRVERIAPRLTARTYSFIHLNSDLLTAHYEIAYDVEEARTRQLSLLLPAATPPDVSIRALDGVSIKEYEGTVVDGMRRWTVLLAERHRDTVRLAVDFEYRLDDLDEAELQLPIIRADGVAYQSGFVAVEGSPEVDLKITRHPRPVDVGELAGAAYQPDRATLGPARGSNVYAFVGDDPEVAVQMSRPPEYALPSTIVQRAELVTQVSGDGLSQTAARFQLRTKAAYLQIELPDGSTLWAAELDGIPAKPQRESGRLLLSLSAKGAGTLRDLRVVYEMPIAEVAFWGDLKVSAPKLLLRSGEEDASSIEVPVADLVWHILLPDGFEIVKHGGTVTGDRLPSPEPAAWAVARLLYSLTGGVHPFYYLPQLSRARELSHRSMPSVVGTPSMIWKPAGAEADRMERSPRRETAPKKDRRSRGGKAKKKRKALPPPGIPIGGVSSSEDLEQEESGERGDRLRIAPDDKSGFYDQERPKADGKQALAQQRRVWALEGVRSLKIDLQQSGQAVAFRSLGNDPRLSVTLANRHRVQSLAWGLAVGIGVIGLALTNRAARIKAKYVVAVLLAATLIPLVSGSPGLMHLANPAVYVVSLLVPFYLAVRFLKWLVGRVRRLHPLPAAATTALALVLFLGSVAQANPPDPRGQEDDPLYVHLVESAGPIDVPEDAIIVPYDPQASDITMSRPVQADQLLIPYQKYVELWNQAYPSDPVEVDERTAGYALAGAAFTVTLEGDEYLIFEGYLDIDLHTDKPVAVPLALGGGVLARAMLDGAPARLGVARVVPAGEEQNTNRGQAEGLMAVPLTLPVQGRGLHRLDLTVRMKLARQGGWSTVAGRLPAAAATALTLRVPQAGTEVRLSGAWDRRTYETTSPDETIETALGANGLIQVEWRPQIHEGYVDPSLTAASEALFDVREDGLRLTWELNLDFGRSERDAFSVSVAGDYQVQTVDGPNVRGWVAHPAETADGSKPDQELQVTLLKPARQSGSVAIILQRALLIDESAAATIGVPVIRVAGAILHKGRLTIRRSPVLQLQTIRAAGVTRTDASEDVNKLSQMSGDGGDSPLGVQVYQAYRFAALPINVEMTATAWDHRPMVDVETVLRIGERERNIESRINIYSKWYPVYRLRIVVPDDLKIDQVTLPAAFEWSVTSEDDQKVLNVYLATRCQGRSSILIRGTLGEPGPIAALALPRLEVLDATEQQGEIVIQVDPAFDVQLADLQNCREISLEQTYGWLTVAQRPLSRVALHYNSPDYTGRLRLSQREPIVTCSTITNVRVTEAAVEDTILLDFNVARAGIRSISFLLPNWLKDSHITLPMLRQKTVRPVSDEPDAPVRVELQLQDDVMGRLRVLVENDRLLTSQPQRAPVPVVETGRVERQFVTLENTGRDELVVNELVGLEALSHQQKEWRTLTGLLGTSITRAYVVNAPEPLLSFKTTERVAVTTAGARIGLAETVLVADAHGAYRAAQSYRIDNRTEQFLEVELPQGGQLWSVMVAGEPVKPAQLPGTADPRRVRIPLIRTAAGDVDYIVLVKYGGAMPVPGGGRRVDFPLMRTVNVPVELSQVRLFLSETHRWMDFGGTMRRVPSEGDLAAGLVRYQTRMTQRLLQAMQSDSPFAQVRAAANVQNLRFQMGVQEKGARRYAYSRDLEKELISNEAIVRQAEEQSQQLAGQQQQRGAAYDNRGQLNALFENQRISRARNLVQGLDDNFSQPAEQERQEQFGQQRFSGEWLAMNRLSAVGVTGPPGEYAQGPPDQGNISLGYVEELSPIRRDIQRRQEAQLGQLAEPRAEQRQKKSRRGRRGGTDEAVAQYQQQLQGQLQSGESACTFDSCTSSSTIADDKGSAMTPPGAGGIAGGERAAGLASLAVELPVRGVPFYFTTPRGEVAITARAVSVRFTDTLRRIGLALVVIVIAAAVYAGVRRRGLSWLESRAWSMLLIALGLAGIVIGVLPILGLVVIVIGIVARLNLRRRERAAAVA